MAEPLETANAGNTGSLLRADFVKHLASAEASFMLIECLMHLLIKHQIFTSQQLVSAIEDAIATKLQMLAEGEHPQIAGVASGQLKSLANSIASGDKSGTTGGH